MIPWLLLFGVGGAAVVVASKAKRRTCTKPPCARKTTTTRPPPKSKPGTKLEVTEPFTRHYFDKLIDRRVWDDREIVKVVEWELKLLDLSSDVVKLRVEATIASTDDRPVVILAGGDVENPGFGNVWSPVCARYAIELDVAEVDDQRFVRRTVPPQMLANLGGDDGTHCHAAMYGAENGINFIAIETARNVDGNLLVRLIYRAWNDAGGRWIPGLLTAEHPGGGLVWVEGHIDAVRPYKPA
jgi:hypothetical protein